MKRWVAVLGGLVAALVSGCGGSAVILVATPKGGVVSLDGTRVEALGHARRLMSESCGGAYRILSERRVFAGVLRGRPMTESQIQYACGPSPERPIGSPREE